MEVVQIDFSKFSNYLSKNGIKPSFQRLKILERMYNKKDHPTANEIYTDLLPEIPSLSKTTVYNTINLFLKNGLVRGVDTDSNETRYDLVTDAHGHFICIQCKKIYDIDVSGVDIERIKLEGNQVISTNVTIKGVCKNCLEEKMYKGE